MISLLVVNYRAAALAAGAIRSARASTSQPLQVVVVDNSCEASEAESLRDCADALIVADTNRGYAGGINLGRRACEGGSIIVSNPDVAFAPGAIDALVNADAAIAGPALFWDEAHEWRLPPGDLLTGTQKLDEVLASRSAAWRAERNRRRFKSRVAFWSLTQTTNVRMLSGAVMAVRARDFDDLGGFDERFALYFEETDFLRRAVERRKRIAYVPSAHCRHLFNQSARQTPELAASRYVESEVRYLEKWLGPFAARALKKLERPMHADLPPLLEHPIEIDRDDVVVEASPLATFATAAGHFPRAGRVSLPQVPEAAFVRIVERDTAKVLATYRIKP